MERRHLVEAGAEKPDIWAPGDDIISSLPGGAYGAGDGSSMSAAMVAGAVAVVLGDSTDTAAAVQELLATASPVATVPPCRAADSSAALAEPDDQTADAAVSVDLSSIGPG